MNFQFLLIHNLPTGVVFLFSNSKKVFDDLGCVWGPDDVATEYIESVVGMTAMPVKSLVDEMVLDLKRTFDCKTTHLIPTEKITNCYYFSIRMVKYVGGDDKKLIKDITKLYSVFGYVLNLPWAFDILQMKQTKSQMSQTGIVQESALFTEPECDPVEIDVESMEAGYRVYEMEIYRHIQEQDE